MEKEAVLYYTPPSDEHFAEMRIECIGMWLAHQDIPGARGHIQRIRHMENIGDNFCQMLRMFDSVYQIEIIEKLSEGAKAELRLRLLSGGWGELDLDRLGLPRRLSTAGLSKKQIYHKLYVKRIPTRTSTRAARPAGELNSRDITHSSATNKIHNKSSEQTSLREKEERD